MSVKSVFHLNAKCSLPRRCSLGELVFRASLKTPAWEAMLSADNKKFHLFWLLLMSLSTWLVKWLTTRKLSISSGSKASRERTSEERQSH